MLLDRPRGERPRGTAVLLCPPFGWHEVCAYRGIRAWAGALTAAGYPAARLALPATGDSAGQPGEGGLLTAWTESVSVAAERLRALTGCPRIAVVGIELGGLLAAHAQGVGAPIDDLALWNVPARGASLLRELWAFGRIVDGLYPEDQREEDAGTRNLVGYPMSALTARELGELDLTADPKLGGPGRRVLLLGRDEAAVNAPLVLACQASGAEVDVVGGLGYERLMAPPQSSQTPSETVTETIAWLDRGFDPARRAAAPAAHRPLRCGERGRVRETPLWLTGDRGEPYGVLSLDADGPRARTCVVLLSSGGIGRGGPNRDWVKLGRRWAARGLPCVRVDLSGIGEAAPDDPQLLRTPNLHARWRAAEVRSILDQLEARAIADRFVLVGACSGAYVALRAGREDPRVTGLMLINPSAFLWSEELMLGRILKYGVGGALNRSAGGATVDPKLWALATRSAPAARGRLSGAQRERLRRLLSSARPDRAWKVLTQEPERRERREMRRTLDALSRRAVQTLLFLSRDEPMLRQLERHHLLDALRASPGLTLALGSSRDHMYRAEWAQREVDRAMEAAIERTLAREPAAAASRAPRPHDGRSSRPLMRA